MRYNPKNRQFKGLKLKTWASIIIVILITVILVSINAWYQGNFNHYVYAEKTAVLPPATQTVDKDSIEAYMKAIFNSDYRVARAVQYNECSPRNPKYPNKCVYITSQEYSCGIFQINLKAHWNKVPVGKTFEEKCAYLNNPYNNILVAKSIFSDSGFYPWSAYTSGRYLNDL